MKKLLLTMNLLTITVGSAALQISNSSLQANNNNNNYNKLEVQKSQDQFIYNHYKNTDLDLTTKIINAEKNYKKVSQIKFNWDKISKNYQTILSNNVINDQTNKSLQLEQLQTNNQLKVQYKNTPFDGVNKFVFGFFVSTVYISENLLSYITQQIINWHHKEVETIVETIFAVLMLVGLRTTGAVIGAIAAVLYCYFQVLSAVDEGQGVGFYLLLQVILSGAWAQ